MNLNSTRRKMMKKMMTKAVNYLEETMTKTTMI